MSVAWLAGRAPSASLATMMPTSTSSRISRTPTAASRGTFIRRLRAVISSAYPASARPATMIVVGTAPFTLDMLLRFVVPGAGPTVRALDRGLSLALWLTVAGDRTTIMTTATCQEENTHDPDQHQDADPARKDGRVASLGRLLRQGRQLRGRLLVLPVLPESYRRQRVRLHRGLQGRRGGRHARQAAVREEVLRHRTRFGRHAAADNLHRHPARRLRPDGRDPAALTYRRGPAPLAARATLRTGLLRQRFVNCCRSGDLVHSGHGVQGKARINVRERAAAGSIFPAHRIAEHRRVHSRDHQRRLLPEHTQGRAAHLLTSGTVNETAVVIERRTIERPGGLERGPLSGKQDLVDQHRIMIAAKRGL